MYTRFLLKIKARILWGPVYETNIKGALSRILTDFWTAKIYICVEGNQKIIVHFYEQLLYLSTETVKKRL